MSQTTKRVRKTPAAAEKQPIHYTANYIIDPAHPITINVIGCGGTGSQVLNSLARMNAALKALGHPGLFVRAIDPDKVSSANMGRQLFSPSDLYLHKCIALVGKINRFFGTDWEAIPMLYDSTCTIKPANITISCVDSGKARKQIKGHLAQFHENEHGRRANMRWVEPNERTYYWMDFGNMMDRGQMVIGTVNDIDQPGISHFRCVSTLPTVDILHPDILTDNKKDDQGPSCSLAEALQKQDLFINTNLANAGLAILWKMFREARTKYHGCYLNLETMSLNPLKVK